ncbi:carboxy terminal-processing peptidase [Suttonella sp. R2A3]|uniref:carboxy terminal-processing peptidase n=1 Tax=Suttonella sp. R2A3 TaxID=2908648 RepID=UPI001F45A043|nr:carboxy terminal-processing peptidase [Suttonella sp. R2A3]UJF25171.1 carboxy terminal-processing peptidase [Suttonella sp. R2A3]
MLRAIVSVWLMALMLSCASATAPKDAPVIDEITPTFEPLVVEERYKRALLLVAKLLEGHHYKNEALNGVSEDIFDDYLDTLDRAKLYFLRDDIEQFTNQRAAFLKQLGEPTLDSVFEIFDRYRQRAQAINTWTLERLQQPFDLQSEQSFYAPPFHVESTRDWLPDLAAVHAYQEKRLTDQIIRQMLGGKSEEEAIETLTKRYTNAQKQLAQTGADDVFDIFMNVMTTRYDPHSNYLSPRSSEDFDMNMRLSLEGIGAVLSIDDEKITIRELIAGGPAAKSGKLRIRDQIIGVAQGEDGEMVDVVGWRLDKAVRLIRGEKGSLVRLLIEPANNSGAPKEISLIREEVKLEDQSAQAYVEEVTRDGKTQRIGVIRLPSFYMDFSAAQAGKKQYRSTSRDVKALLEELKADDVAGIVLDLRGNGGGSLYEAVHTVGLFIDQGPVVMVSNRRDSPREEVDDVPGAVYDGPLAVMVDHYSASASEIFAGAIQDYKRGLVIGSNSFGKGTVQTMVDLNEFVPQGQSELGKLKFTVAMFHRVTGDSTQLKGVAPDIIMPEGLGLDVVGEQAENHALPWKQIDASDYQAAQSIEKNTIAQLKEAHLARMHTDPALLRYQAFIKRVTEDNNREQWSLNLAERQATFKDWEDYRDEYELAQREALPALASDAKRLSDIEERNQYVDKEADKEHFVPDVALFEALNVLYDYLTLISNEQQISVASTND